MEQGDQLLLKRQAMGSTVTFSHTSALSARVLGVGCWAGGVAKPNTQHPTPKTLLGNALVWHFRPRFRPQALQEFARSSVVVARVGRFDTQKKVAARGHLEVRRIEDRVVRLRQAVERQQAKHCCEHRAE